MQLIIQEEEPNKPSTKLSTLGETLTDIAKHRGCTPDLLTKSIRGDLDWIVMKALEKDRIRRYETANEFARDIQRYLGNEPISAGSPGMIYSAHKFVRRHRTSMAFGLVFIASLIIGLSLAIIGFVQASRQRNLAEINFKKARGAVDQLIQLVEEFGRIPGMEELSDSPQVAQIKKDWLEIALKYYEGFLEERSSDLNVRYETAHAYMRVGEITRNLHQNKRAEETFLKAINLLEKLVAESPKEFDYHQDLAFAYHGYGEMLSDTGRLKEKSEVYQKAVISWGNAIELDPNNIGCWAGRAEVYRELEQWDKAISDTSKAIELEPGAGWLLGRRADVYREIDQWDKALADYSKAIELGPGDAWIWCGRADVYRALGQWDKALADSNKAIELDPGFSWSWSERANVYRELGQPYKAISDISEAIELVPDEEYYLGVRADIYKGIGQLDKAKADYSTLIGIYSKGINLNPANTWNWSERADVYMQLGQFDKALADSNKAIELDPGNSGPWSGRANVYREFKQWDKALADYNKAIELKPDYGGKWWGRAAVYRELGQLDKAIADYSKAIELDPGASWLWSNRANVYRQLGQFDQALADYSKAIELEPGDGGNWSRRAEVYRELGQRDKADSDYSKAIDLYSKAIEFNPYNPHYWHRRGVSYLQLGEPNKAVADYSKAIELDPNDSGRWITRANTSSSMEQWNKAITDYSKAIELDPNNANCWYFNSLAYLGMGDTEDYRNRCAQMLEHFGQTQEAAAAHWVAWTGALAPDAVENMESVVELAELAIEKGEQTDQNRNALGAVLYRAGRFDEAVQILSDLASEWEQGRELPTQTSPAYTWFFLAMAHHQLGNADQAQYWFDKGLERTEEELQDTPAWNRKLTLELLREEATKLLDITQETVTTGENNE